MGLDEGGGVYLPIEPPKKYNVVVTYVHTDTETGMFMFESFEGIVRVAFGDGFMILTADNGVEFNINIRSVLTYYVTEQEETPAMKSAKVVPLCGKEPSK